MEKVRPPHFRFSDEENQILQEAYQEGAKDAVKKCQAIGNEEKQILEETYQEGANDAVKNARLLETKRNRYSKKPINKVSKTPLKSPSHPQRSWVMKRSALKLGCLKDDQWMKVYQLKSSMRR